MEYDYGVADGGSGLLLCAVDTVKTDYLAEKQNVVYMILDVRGPSRGPQAAMSYCGAGTEGAIGLARVQNLSQANARSPSAPLRTSLHSAE